MIKVNGSLIDEMHIVGIGPLYRLNMLDGFQAVKFTYNVYLHSYAIEISTDKMNVLFEDSKIEAKKIFEKFRDEYRALYNAIQDGDIEIYKTYCALVEQEKKQKENPQA